MMRKRPGETPQKAGSRWERFWASLFGVEPRKGSGALWHLKLDVADGSILWSCKWTSHASFRVDKELLREADEAVYKDGKNSIPGIAIALDEGSETVVVLRASDFLRLMSSDAAKYITPSRADQKRATAKVPNLLRETEDPDSPIFKPPRLDQELREGFQGRVRRPSSET